MNAAINVFAFIEVHGSICMCGQALLFTNSMYVCCTYVQSPPGMSNDLIFSIFYSENGLKNETTEKSKL